MRVREDLKGDPRYKDQPGRFRHSDDVEFLVNDWLKALTKTQALKRLRKYKVPCAQISDFDEVIEDPQLNYRGMIKDVVHPEKFKIYEKWDSLDKQKDFTKYLQTEGLFSKLKETLNEGPSAETYSTNS